MLQELEKQIAEGKFDTAVPSSSTPRSATPAAAATPPLNVSVLKTAPSSSTASADNTKATASATVSFFLRRQVNSECMYKGSNVYLLCIKAKIVFREHLLKCLPLFFKNSLIPGKLSSIKTKCDWSSLLTRTKKF